jgi:hypothetical protein
MSELGATTLLIRQVAVTTPIRITAAAAMSNRP